MPLHFNQYPLLLALGLSLSQMAWATDWTAYGGDQGGMRHVSASQITAANVDELTRAWVYRTGHVSVPEDALKNSKFEATPILVEGKLALCTPFNQVIALDPGSGRELWRFDPLIKLDYQPDNLFNCRGVSYWQDSAAPAGQACRSRLFMGSMDNRLISLDLDTGKPCPDFGENGSVNINPSMPLLRPGEMQITSPPAIAGDVVVVGSAIGDNSRAVAPSGAVHAFDAGSGRLLWRFDPVPRTLEDARTQGWDGSAAPSAGHANAWAPMSVDAERGLIFVPTSSPSPDFFGGLRPGDNRYANSVVALDALTGKVHWAYQTVHHDVWDYDVPAQPMLASINRDGKNIDVVIQLTKTGLVFTLERDSGKPVFPVHEQAMPQDGAAGEVLSPTQPVPSAPPALTPSTLPAAFGFTPWDRAACQKRMDAARNEGLFTPPSTQGTIIYPFTGGGANWGGGAFDPVHNRLFINTSNAMHLVTLIPRAEDLAAHTGESKHAEGYAPMTGAPYSMTREVILSPLGVPCNPPPWGSLSAVDMDTGSLAWRSTLGTTEEIAPLGIALATGTPNLGGPLVTASGLVFIGAAMDRYLRAFAADNGEELWQGRLPAGGQATPMSYEWQGRQYVVIAAGGHGEAGTPRGDYVVAFALPVAGEAGRSLLSRVLDYPGGRFNLAAVTVALLLLLLGLRWWKRRS